MKNLVLTVLVTLVLTACGSPAPTMAPTSAPPAVIPPQPTQAPSAATAVLDDGATLLETRCSACHSADRAKQASKTHEQWDQTVTRMIGKGAQLTEAEKTVLLDYLAKTYGP